MLVHVMGARSGQRSRAITVGQARSTFELQCASNIQLQFPPSIKVMSYAINQPFGTRLQEWAVPHKNLM